MSPKDQNWSRLNLKTRADSKILKYKILDGLEGLKSRSESKQTCTYIENRIPLMKAFRLAGEIKAILFKCNIPLTGSNPQNFASTEIQEELLKQKR